MFTGKIIPLKSNLAAVRTRLGWTVMGKCYGSEPSVETKHSLLISSLLTQTQCISDLWNLDVLGITGTAYRQTAKELEEETMKYFNETLCINAEGRYEFALPWVADDFSLSENRKLAEKGLMSTKRKLMASGKLEAYGEVFEIWAIHLELITSLTTEAFFQSQKRFASRRGRPTTIYSDNGTNFNGPERFLHALDWDSILARVAEEKI
ncbi:DUF1758 domain-containing protein [Trichonephila clavipes]|uniref:DUF1758 domain-containing protein n=1 Tax=Trichonephila clavipes TaxID=2585209 RepID=A0A8X7BBT4_TRICX|nr:DUF1758 domain-containing protein [Trichonephila clavipes]